MGRTTGSLRPVTVLVAFAFVVGLPAALEVWHSYAQATTAAERSAMRLVRLLAEQTERTIQVIDFTLIGMRDVLLGAPEMPAHDPAFHAELQERLRILPFVRGLFVVGPDGLVIHNTDYPGRVRESLADRSYFKVHELAPDIGLHIGPPLPSRSVGTLFVSVSRRITDADGGFAGVVVAAVEPRSLKSFYEGLSTGEEILIALALKDGTVVARLPHHDETVGRVFGDSPLLKVALERGSGVAWSTSPVDGVRRVVGYRAVAGGSLVLFTGWSTRTVYEAWIDHATIVGGGSILVWALASGLTLLWLEYRARERLEQVRREQSQRLEMIGRMAGGIAHDLGNTIKIARTTFALLKPSLASQHDAMALVEDADRSLKSAFEIIDRLLAIARRQELSPRATELGHLISGFMPILRQAAGPRITLNTVIDKPLVCLIDPIRLEAALLNLVLNSKDAMPDGGWIAVELHEVQPRPDRASWRMKGPRAEARAWAEIIVRDGGSGMTREVLDRAFEPFFTTRAGGSGLGLSQVLGFVQQSSGEVNIDSRFGSGTTIRLRFPTVADSAEPIRPIAPTISPGRRHP